MNGFEIIVGVALIVVIAWLIILSVLVASNRGMISPQPTVATTGGASTVVNGANGNDFQPIVDTAPPAVATASSVVVQQSADTNANTTTNPSTTPSVPFGPRVSTEMGPNGEMIQVIEHPTQNVASIPAGAVENKRP